MLVGEDEKPEMEPPVELDAVTLSEVGTKLDLARAYVDMGDPDGARSTSSRMGVNGVRGRSTTRRSR